MVPRYADLAPAAAVTSIVIRGEFQPGLFGPAWFYAATLINEREYRENDVRSISGEAADFSVGAIDVYVTKDILQLGSRHPEQARKLRDVAAGALRELQGHRVSAIGINRAFHRWRRKRRGRGTAGAGRTTASEDRTRPLL